MTAKPTVAKLADLHQPPPLASPVSIWHQRARAVETSVRSASNVAYVSSPLVIGSASAAKGAPTTIGNLDSALVAHVDPCGRVTPGPSSWSLDWWIGAEDRWHMPAQEVAVRQRLIDASPVVETAMRIPGGDAIQRVYAMRRSSLDNGGELVIVEVENRSKVPVAMAFAIRPGVCEGPGTIEHIDLREEAIVTVDGHPALLLPKPPARSCVSTSAGADILEVVKAGEAGESWSGPARSVDGIAQAALVYPLTHGTSLQVALPLAPSSHRAQGPPTRWPKLRRRSQEPDPTFPQTVPGATDVARGWSAQVRRGMRLELPDNRLTEGVKAALCSLLLLHDTERATGSPGQRHQRPLDSRDAASLLHAMDLHGFHEEVARAIASSAGSQRDGFFPRSQRDGAPDAAVLWTLAQHWRLTRDAELVRAMVDAIAGSATTIARARTRSQMPSRSDLWRAAGLRAAAELLAVADQPKAAEDATRLAEATVEDPETGESPYPAAAKPPDSLLANLPMIGDPAVHHDREGTGEAGQHPLLIAQLAGAELLAGDRRCLEHLAALLGAASPTWTWTDEGHSRLPDTMAGPGYHALVAAGLLQIVRHLLVRETGWDVEQETNGLAMAPLVPDTWLGQGWEVHDAPTAHGQFSYAVRWHGERPALLWELQAHGDGTGAPAIRLTAPGLDPSWSTTAPTGEALLQEFSLG